MKAVKPTSTNSERATALWIDVTVILLFIYYSLLVQLVTVSQTFGEILKIILLNQKN